MQTRTSRTAMLAAFTLAVFPIALHSATSGFPAQGDDLTQSLGQFQIVVNPAFQAMMAGYPGYSGTSKVLTSPILYDPSTIIGRSSPLLDGSAGDAGVPVGSAGTIIGASNLIVQPGAFGPANTRQVYTQLRSLNMIGGGAAVRAGTNALTQPISPGEVESLSGPSQNSNQDFPAKSFFDVFVDVDIPSGGTFPGATNLFNTLPLLIQNTNLTSFPPTVVYVHGMSTAVPILFPSNSLYAGQTFGILQLAGHGVFQTNSSTGTSTSVGTATTNLQATLAATPLAPVEPQYATWATGLTVANSNTMIFPGKSDDTTTSLGTFRLAVNPAYQAWLTGNPNWNTNTKRLTSPLLYDPGTIIGRSSPLTNGSAADSNGVSVGSVGTIVASSNLTLIPPFFSGPNGTREVHTQIRSLDLAGSGAAVRAGTAAPGIPGSFGEVQSLSGNSGDPYWDFPAKSFFDIFVDVDIPLGGSLPTVTVSNGTPLIVQNSDLTVFPPKVIYVHGNSTAVPVLFASNYPTLGVTAGETFGILLLAGHGVGYNQNNTNDVAQFQQQVAQLPEQPVAPQYVTWAPNLNTNAPTATNSISLTCSSNLTVAATDGASGAYAYYSSSATGGCSTPVITYNPPSGSYLPVGTTTVSCIATDTCGDSASCSFTVMVTPPPVINCSTNIVVTTGSTNGAVVNFTAGLTGGCAPTTMYASPYSSGATFPLGTTYESIYFYDCNGYEGYCSFTVTVTDTKTVPLVVTCPSNITVMASSSSGAVVNFTYGISGGCPPQYAYTSPYVSGSTFPVGTTTEYLYVYDTCLGYYSNYCDFTVTVNLPTNSAVNEYFSPQPLLPPANSVYISPAQWHVLFSQGIVIRNVRHHFFTQNYTLPTLGNTQTETFSSELEYELSNDNGTTFHPATGTANVTVQVTHSFDNNGLSFFNTQMTQLNLTGNGFLLQVEPTQQSTGQTTVRPVAGGYMISSFFDIFTELSTDGGNTWTPASGPGHVEMRPDPAQVEPTPEPTPLLPPPNDHYVSPQQWHALFAQGIVIKNVSHKLFAGSLLPPTSGTTNTESFNSTLDMQVSTDGGNTFTFMDVTDAPVQITVDNASSSSDNTFYDTTMTSLNATLPNGMMIRASQTEPSRGETEIDAQSDGTFRITSFFDIFTELSLDGGNTWSPGSNGPVRMQLTPQAPEVTATTPKLPLTSQPYVSPAQWHALYANGIILTNVSHNQFTKTQPPPASGGTSTENFGSMVNGLISENGGASFLPFSAPANVTVQVNSQSNLDNGSTRYFDTQILQLTASGGSLPSGVMIRQSPTLPSVGRTSERTDTNGGFHISSFFDIFTEISLDGGNTWSPSTTGPATMSPGVNTNASAAILLNCPSNITVNATSSSGATVYYNVTASGGCTPPPYVTVNPPSGSSFPIGTTTVTTTASDTCGNSTNCSFTVTVVAPPIGINCSSNLTATASGPYGATVYFNVTATGGCSPPPFVSAYPASGSTFPVGTTTVTATASDNCGTYTNCSFTVTVNAETNPPIVLNCPSNITVTATGPSGTLVFFNATATGGCSPPPYVNAYPASGSTFSIGTTTVYTTASDSCGNSTNCSFTVTVNPPTNCTVSVYCPSNIIVTSSSATNVFFTVTASDSCGGIPIVYSTPPSGSTFPIGTTTVTSTAYDANGTNICSFTVTVVRSNSPIVLTCSTNLVIASSEDNGGAYVSFTVTASGGCGSLTINSSPGSGDFFPLGTNTVYVVASDGCGNSNSCSFTVTVYDPAILLTCSSNLVVTANMPGGAEVFFNVTATGGCDGAPSVQSYPPSGGFFPLGTTIVSSTASDTCGASTNCSFTVTVNPPPPIVLNCSSNLTVTATGSGGATVFYSVTASGGCSAPTITAFPPSGSTFPPGPTVVYVTASDSCGTTTNCSFVVTVVAPPIVLNCSSNLTVTATRPGGATVFFNVTASGGCSTPSVSAYPPSGSTFPPGSTIVYVTASDGCGTSTNCSFIVTVSRPAIVLNCSSNLAVTATGPGGAPVFFNVTASGGCGTPTVSAYPPSGSTFPVGTTIVYTTASDACGDSTNCSFVVTVSRPAIVLNCSSNLTVAATSTNGATVFFNVTASGGCSTPTVRAYPPSGSTFPAGVTTVYTTAADGCDGFTNCSFTVTVTSTNAAASGPKLSIRLTGTNHILLAWPTNTALTYSIAQISSLGGTNWTTLSNQPTVVGSSNQLVLVLSNLQSFFRLTSPSSNTSPCIVSLTLTNCDQPESVTLAAPGSIPAVNEGSPESLTATLNTTPGLVAVVSYYTNSTGYSANCPDTFVTNMVSPTVLSNSWIVQGPGGFTASGSGLNAVFTPTTCGVGTIEFTTTWQHVCDAGQSTTFATAAFKVNCPTNCLVAGLSTNCAVAGSISLTNTTAGTNYCFGNAVTASVANLPATNSQVIITTTYTNAAGAVTTNCPPTFVTNSIAPMVVSNWWTVSGPGSYTNSGAGLTATFTPTNGGTGKVTFNLAYMNQTPCATNVKTAPPIQVPFNVIQITNITSSYFPTNETRLLLGVGERDLLSLAGGPGGNYTWSTTAGSVSPTNGLATTFTAPSNAANATVSVNYNGGSCPLTFTVIVPSGILASNTALNIFDPNEAGAGMINNLWFLPPTVSFYRLQWMEVPATSNLNVNGYFANTNFFPTPASLPLHDFAHGSGRWIGPIRQNNLIGFDRASSGTTIVNYQPWAAGSFTWPIPLVWQIGNGGPTNLLQRTDQTFSIDANGNVTVQKYGHTVTRGTNNVYSVVN